MTPWTHRIPLLLMLLATAAAADVKVFGAGERVDPNEVARILEHGAQPRLGKMRGLTLLDEAPAPRAGRPSAVVAGAAAADALSLPVPFAFDSAEILPEAKQQLDALAAGIRMLPAAQVVVIEGHTDAVGSDAYNETLSVRRAYAVRRYLVAVHGIESRRLQAVGLGEHAPLSGTHPDDAANRRVQFRGE